MTNKKLITIIVLLLSLTLFFSSTSQAKLYKGKWRKNCTWTYDTKTKKLVVTGTGFVEGGGSDCGDNPKWEKWMEEIQEIEIRGDVTRIGGCFCLNYSKLKKITMNNSMRRLDEYSLTMNDYLRKVVLSNQLEEIGEEALSHCDITDIYIPDSVVTMGKNALACNPLLNVHLSKNLKKIEEDVFCYCEKLCHISIPDKVTSIEEGAFAKTGLKKVIIPKNVRKIGKEVFFYSSSLKKVTIKSKKIKKWGKDIFYGTHKDLVIEVPQCKKKEYTKALREKGLPSYVKVVGKKSLG